MPLSAVHHFVVRPCQTIRALEREKDRLVGEANDAASKYQKAQQELELRDKAIGELQNRIAGGLRSGIRREGAVCWLGACAALTAAWWAGLVGRSLPPS